MFTIEHLGNPHIKSFADVKKDEMLAFLDESKGEAILNCEKPEHSEYLNANSPLPFHS
ncbi:hypothetical protein D3C80_2154530 [compost metagenome]